MLLHSIEVVVLVVALFVVVVVVVVLVLLLAIVFFGVMCNRFHRYAPLMERITQSSASSILNIKLLEVHLGMNFKPHVLPCVVCFVDVFGRLRDC